jgi:hypothetical protein
MGGPRLESLPVLTWRETAVSACVDITPRCTCGLFGSLFCGFVVMSPVLFFRSFFLNPQ